MALRSGAPLIRDRQELGAERSRFCSAPRVLSSPYPPMRGPRCAAPGTRPSYVNADDPSTLDRASWLGGEPQPARGLKRLEVEGADLDRPAGIDGDRNAVLCYGGR